MFRALLTLALLVATTLTCAAQDELQPPSFIPQWVVLTSSQAELVMMKFPNNDTSVLEPYTVNIPFQAVDADGKVEVKFNTENRLRQRKITDGEAKLPKTIRWRTKDLVFMDLMGTKLDFNKDVLTRISKPTPAMAIAESAIDPFFAQVLKSDTIIVVVPMKK